MTHNEFEGRNVEHDDGNYGGASTVNDWWKGVLQSQPDATVFAADGCDKALRENKEIKQKVVIIYI